MAVHGSVRPGPSQLYLKLLKGEISPEEYAEKAKKRASEGSRKRPDSPGAEPQRKRSS